MGTTMKIFELLGGAAAVIAGTAIAAAQPALMHGKQAHRFITGAPHGSNTLYDQNRDAAGSAVLSDDSSPQAADDFTVPNGHTWTITELDVTGIYFNGYGPANSETVSFYKDKGGLPGHLAAQCANLNGADNGTGSFAIALPKSCNAKLSGGKTYWVSVQANIASTQWGWELSSEINGSPAVWQDGGTCPAWCSLGSDLMFALKGKDKR